MILSFCRVLFGKDCTRISHLPPSNASRGILRAQTPRDAQRIIRLLPIILSTLLLVAAIALFYISWHERHIEQQRFEAMTAQANSYIAKERDYLLEMINSHDTFDRNNSEDAKAYALCLTQYNEYVQSQWVVRDSLMNLYPENDPLREQFWQLWVHLEAEMNNELLPFLFAKLQDTH